MLSERSLRLLTAFVDGEATPVQLRSVRRLLDESAEAREFLQRLRSDAARLRDLPCIGLDRDLSESIVRAIGRRTLRLRNRRTASAFPARAVYLAAACFLLIVALSPLLLLDRSRQPKTAGAASGAVATAKPSNPPAAAPAQPVAATPPPRIAESVGTEHARKVPPVAETASAKPAAKEPAAAADPPVVTAPAMELFRPERIEPVALPVVLPFRDISGDASREKLLEELRRDTAFRIELPCQNTTRAFEKIEAALRTQGVGLVVEETAQVRLRQPQWKTNYVLFVENFLAQEANAVLQEIGRLDGNGRSRETQFTAAVVTRLSKGHRKEFTDLLGVDPVPLEPRESGPLGTDPHKPLPELTAGQVANALSGRAGQGSNSRGSGVNGVDRLALVVTFNPVRPRRGSTDVQHFLDARKPVRDRTLQLLFVLRGI